MSCHTRATKVVDNLEVIKEITPPNDPSGKGCHTYYIHKDGDIWREVNEQGLSPACQDQRGRDGQAHSQIAQQQDICDNDRMTLIHLPKESIVDLDDPPADNDPRQAWPNSKPVPPIPPYLVDKLNNICSSCNCKSEILWRNFHRADSHFDACFRYHDDGKGAKENRCFLNFYALRVPSIAKKALVMSMVHHIRVEKNSFVSAKGGKEANKEHMFGLAAGLEVFDLTEVLTRLIPRWQDLPNDHLKPSAGLTPKLMLSVILSQYGSFTSRYIITSSRLIDKYDNSLKEAQDNSWTLPPIPFKQKQAETDNISKLNELLIDMNKSLTGAKSIMHYLAASAEILIGRVSHFEVYVKSRLEEWDENPASQTLATLLQSLDCCKEALRDKDKLQIVQKSMVQYMVDIDALHQHIEINLSVVRNLIAAKDKAIQFSIARQASMDSFNMKIIAILTVLFLPGTFMAVLLTTPMFKWDHKPDEQLILKLPFEIYWGSSVSMTLLFAIGLRLIIRPKWCLWIVNHLPAKPKQYLQGTNAYLRAKERVDESHAVKVERALQKKSALHGMKSKSKPESGETEDKRRTRVSVKEISPLESVCYD